MSNLTENDDDFVRAMERIVESDDWEHTPAVKIPREVLKRLVDIASGRRNRAEETG